MTLNESNRDRLIRGIVGAVIILAWWLGWVSGALGVVAGIVGFVLLLTGAIGFCPLYAALGLKTREP